ncbi:hypothetical protein CPB86DRAFT_817105 [Serendipita vermifera]|nr:hypothetical protein CPB86DRAFT_817105 [Serendipita vermifera]
MESRPNLYIQVPYIADDGTLQVAHQPIIPSGQYPSLDTTMGPQVVPWDSLHGYSGIQSSESQFSADYEEQEPPANIRSNNGHEIGTIARDICSFGGALLSHLGELALEWCPEAATHANPGIMAPASFRNHVFNHTIGKQKILAIEHEQKRETRLACRQLEQIDYWLVNILREFLKVTPIPEYHECIPVQNFFVFVPSPVSNQGAEYLQRVLTACHTHSVDRRASAQAIGELIIPNSALTIHLGAHVHPSSLHAVELTVLVRRENIALRSCAYKLMDPDLAAIIDDSIGKWK